MEVDLKIVLLGDPRAGKSALAIKYTTDTCPATYTPTIFEHYTTHTVHHGRTIRIGIWESSGHHHHDRFRSFCYSMADVFLLCFSVIDPVSYENIQNKWCMDACMAPVILVGTHIDLRSSTTNAKTWQEGRDLARLIGARDYLECSCFQRQSVHKVFEAAIAEGAPWDSPPKGNDTRCRLC